MFQVLAFVYENYFTRESCPEPAHLERKLNAVGFESDEISDALTWLGALRSAVRPTPPEPWLRQPSATSIRIYLNMEQHHLGPKALGFIRFLDSAGVLPANMRELVIDRAMAAPGAPLSLEDLKIIILMVYWSFDEEPDALILDELCDDVQDRIAH
jgi:Smg protein